MPPKRKRAEDSEATEATSTRATRSSTRLSTGTKNDDSEAPEGAGAASAVAKPKAKRTSAASKKAVNGDDDDAPPVKKTKTKATTPKATKKTTKKKGATIPGENEGQTALNHDDEPGPSTSPTKTKTAIAPKPIAQMKPTISNTKTEPYTPARAAALFATYADSDDPDVIGPEGFQQLCEDAQISMDGALPMILSWQLTSKEMMKISKAEWTAGTSALKVSSPLPLHTLATDLEDILILDKPSLKRSTSSGSRKSDEPYDRSAYWVYAQDTKAAFAKLYTYCFTLAKAPQSRNIEMETSVAFWSVLLVPKYPIMTEVLEFINEKGSYKATNKDLWGMMLEFCETVKPTLEDYEAEGAWPTLLDDFVEWRKSKTESG